MQYNFEICNKIAILAPLACCSRLYQVDIGVNMINNNIYMYICILYIRVQLLRKTFSAKDAHDRMILKISTYHT